jgi:polysaccharide biosynthesis protein PslJ
LRAALGGHTRAEIVSISVAMAAVAALAVTAVGGLPAAPIAMGLLVALGFALAHRRILAWPSLIAILIAIVLFIPIRRYALPGGLPFQLEPYRLLIAVVVAGWLVALLVDPRIRVRATGFEAPIALIVLATLGSVVVNGARVAPLSTDVVKKMTFLLSYILVLYLIVSVIRSRKALDRLIAVLVAGGGILAVLTIIESRTGYNLFDHLSGVVPFLHLVETPRIDARGARLRALASAQHPIALGAALVMLVPLAIYLARRQGRRLWWILGALLAMGAMATVSRTAIVMLLVIILVYLWLRPRETKRLWPLIIPVLIISHVALPGTLGSLKDAFFPSGGLVAEQQSGANTYGSGRLADFGPGLSDFAKQPLLGKGYGTSITDQDRANAPILDDQWLGTLLETGIVGAFGWAWLFTRVVRRLGRAAKADDSADGWLFAGIAASVLAFAVGMWTYDAFSFIQVTILMFMLIAFASALFSIEGAPGGSLARLPRPRPRPALPRAARRRRRLPGISVPTPVPAMAEAADPDAPPAQRPAAEETVLATAARGAERPEP